MTAMDRLVQNGNSIVKSLRDFSSPTPQDVTFDWVNDDNTTETVTYDNVKQYMNKAKIEFGVRTFDVRELKRF